MEHEAQPGAAERAPLEGPRIYVASLADYNAGRLHGRWIDADQMIDDIQQQVAEMLDESTELVAEEYAIHDYEGFGPLQLSEYESLDTVARVAEGIMDHGLAFAHWAAAVGTGEEELASFEDHYLGHWPSMTAFADELADDFGIEQLLDQIPTPFRWYVRIDTEAFGRDLAADYLTSEDGDGVHLWDQR